MPKNWNYKDEHPQSAFTIDEVGKAWFVHSDEVFAVALVEDKLFRAAIQSKIPRRRLLCPPFRDIWGRRERLDLIDRWWLLCALADAGRPMKLYGSQQEAEQAAHLNAREGEDIGEISK